MTSSWAVHPAFWQVVFRAARGPEVSCSNLSKHLGMWSLVRSAKSITKKSRMQLFQDAARIGRVVKVGTAELGLTLSCKSTLLANDKSLGKMIVSHLETDGVPICLGTAATDLGIETSAGKRRCAASQLKRIWKGRRMSKRVNRLCKMNLRRKSSR